MREVAALVGEERVVDRAVDDRRGRVERTLRIGGLDRERVVDDERRDGAADAATPDAATAVTSASDAATATAATRAPGGGFAHGSSVG